MQSFLAICSGAANHEDRASPQLDSAADITTGESGFSSFLTPPVNPRTDPHIRKKNTRWLMVRFWP